MRTWRAAMADALYGHAGFYRREAPADHFRTSVHASGLFAAALHRLATRAGLRAVLDVGAGRGELLRALHRIDPALELTGVDLAARPANLPPAIDWRADLPEPRPVLLVANEWLDNVPLDVVTDGAVTLVDDAGVESPGPRPDAADARWLARWWPNGRRTEVGRSRDEAWAGALAAVSDGLAVAVDYGHRRAERPPGGSLTGYRAGRQVPPVPDGGCDLTAHVAVDSCLAAGSAAAGRPGRLLRQREALRELDVTGARPAVTLARTSPAAYATALARASEAAELTDPAGLGDFWWIVQPVGAVTAAPPSGRCPTP